MDSPLSTLGFVILGITFSIYSVTAESPPLFLPVSRASPRPPPPPPNKTPPSPPPSPNRTPPSPPPSPNRTPPSPPPSPNRTPPSPPPSPNKSPPLPPRRSFPLTWPPHHSLSPPPPPPHFSSPHNLAHRPRHRSAPRPPSHRMNGGKKIGLLFAGIAGIMQIGVVGFLVFKRRQLLRTKDAFEAGA